ncbi:hypothetical protein MRX96_044347 [Rhipicephalus microplus]
MTLTEPTTQVESVSAACNAIYPLFRATGTVVTWRVRCQPEAPPTSVDGKLAFLVVHFLPVYRSPCLSGSAAGTDVRWPAGTWKQGQVFGGSLMQIRKTTGGCFHSQQARITYTNGDQQ